MSYANSTHSRPRIHETLVAKLPANAARVHVTYEGGDDEGWGTLARVWDADGTTIEAPKNGWMWVDGGRFSVEVTDDSTDIDSLLYELCNDIAGGGLDYLDGGGSFNLDLKTGAITDHHGYRSERSEF